MTLRRGLGGLISLATFAAASVLAVLVWIALDARPRTNDGYLQADTVHMAPDVTGRIVSLPVRNNQVVRRGDLLFVVDPEPYQHRLDAAQAKLRGLQAELAIDTNTVASQGSKADAAATSIRAAQAQLTMAAATRRRLEPLGAQGFVTVEDVDKARTAERTAAADLESARQSAQSARQGISSTKPLEEQIAGAQAELAEAEREMRLTRVLSPCDGQVTALDVAEGEYATAGRPVFTLIDTEHWWAVANFRETDLGRMRPGQGATVYLVGFGNRVLRGTVESLGGGVAPDQGSDLGGLPRVPRSLNWVQIAQRFPVRVAIDHPPPGLMRIGATATVVVDR
jgi:membrane fusion protein, multidrug efflux system